MLSPLVVDGCIHSCVYVREWSARAHRRRLQNVLRMSIFGGKLSFASLAVLVPAPHSAVGADGGAPAVLAPASQAVMLTDGCAPAVHASPFSKTKTVRYLTG
jgi:hypothetical protein